MSQTGSKTDEKKITLNDYSVIKAFGVFSLVLCFFVIGFVAGRIFEKENPTGNGSVASAKVDPNQNFDLYWQVWNTLKKEYVDSSLTQDKTLYYGSIKGMVNSLGDPATIFLDPEETQEFNKGNEGKLFEGIGAELGYENGQVVIISPISGSPAEKAGLKPGDIITKVNGEDIKSTDTLLDVVAKVRGKSGTDVVLTIFRKSSNKVMDFTVKRGEITVPSMKISDVPNESGYVVVTISRFTDSNLKVWESNWDQIVEQVNAKKAKGIILDLRGNPGGFFDAALYSASDFLPKGTVVTKQEDKDGKIEEFKVTRNGRLLNKPLVVLVNEGSASASEILSGALQKNNRAKVIGVDSYGKGTAQSVLNLPGGSSLHVTIVKWLLPDGTWLNRKNPIKPDIKVEYTDEEFKQGNDPQMKKAVEEIKATK